MQLHLTSSFTHNNALLYDLEIMGAQVSNPVFDETMYTQPIEGVTLKEKIIVLNGRNINVNRWTPKSAPKAVVLVSHGLHEHGLRYHGVAAVLAKKNYVVIAMDHSSHGCSEGVRGLITDYKILPTDFVSLCKAAHEEFPDIPCFIISHSMGTLVAIMAMRELPFVKAVVFCGCPIFSGPAASSIFASISPMGSAAPVLLDEQTSDEDARIVIRKDSRRFGGDIMNKSAYELIKWITAVKIEIPSIKVPFMCLHGADDKIALPKGSHYLMENSGTQESQKSLHILPNLRHEMFHEKIPHGHQSILKVLDYFENQFFL